MKRSDFRFLERLRVRWAEVDLQKIVFNGHYLMYFDTAVAGYWRALALPYHETMASLHGDLFVRKATLEYEGSARYDEQLHVGIRCARIGKSSMAFAAAVFRGAQCLVHGELVYVFADPATMRSQPVPEALRAVLQGYEAGQAMLNVHRGGWHELAGPTQALRQAVFVEEFGLPALAGNAADADADADADAGALHVLAHNRLGLAVGAGRLLSPAPGVAQIDRLAVNAALRGAGVGSAVLQALLAAARDRGDREVVLNAPSAALALYERAGFVRSGAEFADSGVQHVAMRLAT